MKSSGDALAIVASGVVAFGSMSPASCSMVNRSYGISRFSASMTQSRYFQIERRWSASKPLVSA